MTSTIENYTFTRRGNQYDVFKKGFQKPAYAVTEGKGHGHCDCLGAVNCKHVRFMSMLSDLFPMPQTVEVMAHEVETCPREDCKGLADHWAFYLSHGGYQFVTACRVCDFRRVGF